jgi:C_GCAxxG_C_C family probable redox protein
MPHRELAAKLFTDGYNCAQATAGAFAENFRLDMNRVMIMTAGFGGGMGGLREQCGAVSAMVFLSGAAFGEYDPKDNAKKKELYDLVKKMTAQFKEKYGTTNCRELLAKAAVLPLPDPSERTAEYYKARPCIRFVIEAARIMQENLPAGK